MKNYIQTTIQFKGTEQELINAVKLAKQDARKQVEGANILPSFPVVNLIGRQFVKVSNRHVTCEVSNPSLVESGIYEGTITYGVDSSWPSMANLMENNKTDTDAENYILTA